MPAGVSWGGRVVTLTDVFVKFVSAESLSRVTRPTVELSLGNPLTLYRSQDEQRWTRTSRRLPPQGVGLSGDLTVKWAVTLP